jgi:hypothetical protein
MSRKRIPGQYLAEDDVGEELIGRTLCAEGARLDAREDGRLDRIIDDEEICAKRVFRRFRRTAGVAR